MPITFEARRDSCSRSLALPRVPDSPPVRSSRPTLYPASTILITVPLQVSSVSSGWAVMERTSSCMILGIVNCGLVICQLAGLQFFGGQALILDPQFPIVSSTRSSESVQKFLFVQAVLEGLLAVDEDDWDFFAELPERLLVLDNVDLAPPERMGLLQFAQLGLHLVAETAVGLRVHYYFVHDLNVRILWE